MSPMDACFLLLRMLDVFGVWLVVSLPLRCRTWAFTIPNSCDSEHFVSESVQLKLRLGELT